jgi:hypothetical protein
MPFRRPLDRPKTRPGDRAWNDATIVELIPSSDRSHSPRLVICSRDGERGRRGAFRGSDPNHRQTCQSGPRGVSGNAWPFADRRTGLATVGSRPAHVRDGASAARRRRCSLQHPSWCVRHAAVDWPMNPGGYHCPEMQEHHLHQGLCFASSLQRNLARRSARTGRPVCGDTRLSKDKHRQHLSSGNTRGCFSFGSWHGS